MEEKTIEQLKEELESLKLSNAIQREKGWQTFLSQEMVKRSSWINEFFWWCAGVDKKIIRQCPTDYAKYVGIGGTILFTALMAMLSGGYALFSVFKDFWTAAGFGVFWGLLIFNLDRFIVNTMYSDGKSTINFRELTSGLPRIIMAIFLGIVISTPLELKIFEDEIKVVVAEQIQDRIKKYQEQDNYEIIALTSKKDSILNYRSELMNSPLEVDWTFGNDEKINALISERNQKRDQWKQLDSDIQQRRRQCYALYSKRTHQDSITASGISNSIWKLKKEKDQLSHDINKLNSSIQTLAVNNQDIIEKARNQRDQELERLKEEASAIEHDIEEIGSKIKNDGYKDLIEKEYGGFQAKMSAFSKMKKEDPSTKTSALFIMLLFVIIETAPTFFKMMMEDGPYDKLKHFETYRIEALAKQLESDLNDDINTSISLSTAQNQNRLASEQAANKELMDKMAGAQSELLKVAIDSWKEEELKKIKENPTIYIKKNEG